MRDSNVQPGLLVVVVIIAVIAPVLPAAWAAGKGSKIEEFGLVFEASGEWSKKERDDPDLAVHQRRDDTEQITLSVLRSEERMDARARRRTVDLLVEHRQGAERREMEGKVSFKSVRNSERNGLTVASYCGVDLANGRPFAVLVLASAQTAWALFYETLESPATSFCSRGERLFGTVREARRR
jgi:hypothetical protein